ncbi:hypothetical protein [Bradyrhizobium sp. RD5-C2]|uniref:hypothetical protein n=1 Tax=Bradyrhizobium sp. RD5-C2 TaxID=244562 RepID=UPI001CC3B63D|nr:hypothetical protein [Bradyrhizobium sp. RD5-C2]GIQ76633.1 hypothetical protein BraRD5C2_50800 [Bradyrhizobium sp. RD5-C2]
MIVWTQEEIAQRSTDQIKIIQENAAKQGRSDVVTLCANELEARKPARAKAIKARPSSKQRLREYVSEFHFVCPKETDVTQNADGSTWTGTWVVAEEIVDAALTYGSIVALHTSKAELSYLQGEIRAWRRSPRQRRYADGQTVKTTSGIDFLLTPNDNPVPWHGDGAGEKGYRWAEIPSSAP